MSASHCAVKRINNIADDAHVATHWFDRIWSWAIVLLLMTISHASVAQSEVFVVRDVPVDVRAREASEARNRGLERGRIEALERLFRRLVPRSFYSDLPDLTAREAIDLVQDFSVDNERSSAVRYLADLTVRFQPQAVRSALRFANVPFSETVGKPIAIIPLYQESVVSEPVLWEDPSPWRDAWHQLPEADGLVPRQLPFEDLEDLTTLESGDVLARDRSVLRKWAKRYGADDAVIVSAALLGSIGKESVRVTLYFTRSRVERRIDVRGTIGQTWGALLLDAAAESWDLIEDEWKQENMLQFDVNGQITALVPLTKLQDWITIKNRLLEVPLIDRYELQAITRERAQITLYYLGDEKQLEFAMSQTDLSLVRQQQVWIIKDRRLTETTQLRPSNPVPIAMENTAISQNNLAVEYESEPIYDPYLGEADQSSSR